MPGGTCIIPFTNAEVYPGGEVYLCCPSFSKAGPIGNLFMQPFGKIWNSAAARKIRRAVLTGDYSLCDLGACSQFEARGGVETAESMPPPKSVRFGHDMECNLACAMCRKGVLTYRKGELEKMNRDIGPSYLAMLKGASKATLSVSGDPFASRHSRLLMKSIAERYPGIRFDIFTNGLLCTRRAMAELGLAGKIDAMHVSINAATERTHAKIMRGGGKDKWSRLIRNLDEMAGLRDEGEVRELAFHFVLSQTNYKELPAFLRLAGKYGAKANCTTYMNWGAQDETEERRMSVFKPGHREYGRLARVLHSSEVQKDISALNPLLREIARARVPTLMDKARSLLLRIGL